MKLRVICITVLIVMPFCIQSQNLQPGDHAPEVVIQHWINSKPIEELPDDKFIFLDFWATWCGPCIQSIPHIDSLITQFRDKVIFINISDEKPERVSEFLEKRDLKSYVVTDNFGKTHKNFFIESIPHTVLISPDKIILWRGHALNINAEMMDAFIKEYLIASKSNTESSNNLLTTMDEKEELYSIKIFEIKPLERFVFRNKEHYLHIKYTLSDIINYLLDFPGTRLEVSGDKVNPWLEVNVSGKYYQIDTAKQEILNRLSKFYNFKVYREIKTMGVWLITDDQNVNLTPDSAIMETGVRKKFQSFNNKFHGDNLTLDELSAGLEKYYKAIFINESEIEGEYDWSFNLPIIDTLGLLLKDKYNLNLKEGKREIEMTILEYY